MTTTVEQSQDIKFDNIIEFIKVKEFTQVKE